MRSKIFKWFRISFILLLLYAGGYSYHFVNDGFTLGNISSDYSYDERREARPLLDSEKLHLAAILNQEFTYLGHGAQFYAFLSQDGEHVLKFFRYKRFRHATWLDYVDFIPALDRYRLKMIQEKRKKREKVYASCKLAFDQLQEESGLVFMHLNKTKSLNQWISLTDKMGKKHRINLDEMEFLVQKKAQLLGPYIAHLMAAGNVDEAKGLISEIVAMMRAECAKGLVDDDVTILKNTGVVARKPIHIDIGLFSYHEDFKQPQVTQEKVIRNTHEFNLWLKQKYPELSTHLEGMI